MKTLDVSIAGEINLDLILYGLPADLPVQRELLATDFQQTLGSSSAILAHNLAVLGAKVGFTTRIGQDALGEIALERLAASGVDLSHVVHSAGPVTTGITILLHHGDTRHILTYPGTMSEMTRGDLNFDYLSSARHFHLSSLFLQRGLQPDLPQLFRDLKRAGVTLSLDTNDDPEDRWGGVLKELLGLIDILLPNEDEICRMTGCDSVDAALDVLGPVVPLIAVKCGTRGAIVQHRGQRFVVPPVPVQPIDTIGAGDSFNAGFLFAWLHGADPERCAAAGNITGALSTLRPGGTEAFREPGFWRAFLDQHGFSRLVQGPAS